MQKSKTPRQSFLKKLKRGDKIWIALTNVDSLPLLLAESSIFEAWFDLKGSKGKYCLLASDFDGAIQFPKEQIFPTKKEALEYSMPIVYRKISKEISYLEKAQTKLLDSYHKLLKIEF